MKAVILSGGRGKRLKQLTDYVPKSLIPLNNIPIIEWQIRYLKKFGINDFIICTGYKTEQLEDYLKVKNNFGVKIQFSKELNPLGTGGAIKKAGKLIKKKSFIVMNGDVLTNIDVRKLKTKINSIAAIPLKTRYGIINLSKKKVIRFDEKKEISDYWMNAGIYHLSKNIVKDLPKKGNIEETTFPKYSKKGNLFYFKFRNPFWHSIDSYKDMEECSQELDSKKYIHFISR